MENQKRELIYAYNTTRVHNPFLKRTNELMQWRCHTSEILYKDGAFGRINRCIHYAVSYRIQTAHTFIHKVDYRCVTCGYIYADEHTVGIAL